MSLCPRLFTAVPEMLKAGCACPKPCGETAEMGKVAYPAGKHLKEGREEKTGISLELPWQAGTQRETEA